MIIIFTTQITERLQYVCDFIFNRHFQSDFRIVSNIADVPDENALVINYSFQQLPFSTLSVKPNSILFQSNIQPQETEVFVYEGRPAFFRIEDSDYPFDIFAAIFFLITRYEEYLPHQKDQFGRFSHKESLAYKNNFLQLPLINLWLAEFEKKLRQFNSRIAIDKPAFENIITYDIDIAWSYLNKGWLRNLGGFLKRPSLERIKVLMNLKKDPFDIYDYLIELHGDEEINVMYFFLVAEHRSTLDKNISPKKIRMQELIKKHAQYYEIGLHPSWASNENVLLLEKEKKIIEVLINKPVVKSRQHYLNFSLPQTFQQLLNFGIKEDFSMGYGTINGFRASYAGSFYWFDLFNNRTTSLQLFPFCFMDATTAFKLQKTPTEAWDELVYYHDICKNNNGLMISVFHNHIISQDTLQLGWRALHAKYIQQYCR